MEQPTLYLLIGYPGAGKTTTANYICEATGAIHIWADQERARMFGSPTHTPEESLELYQNLNNRTAELLEAGQSVVFDTSFNFHKDREHLRMIAEQALARTVLVQMNTPKDVAKARATHGNHAERNGMNSAMTDEAFERIASHYEPLRENETAIVIDGTTAGKQQILEALGIQT